MSGLGCRPDGRRSCHSCLGSDFSLPSRKRGGNWKFNRWPGRGVLFSLLFFGGSGVAGAQRIFNPTFLPTVPFFLKFVLPDLPSWGMIQRRCEVPSPQGNLALHLQPCWISARQAGRKLHDPQNSGVSPVDREPGRAVRLQRLQWLPAVPPQRVSPLVQQSPH